MRRLLGRKAVTIIAAIISLTVIPAAGITATAAPALADVTGTICNSSGHMYCIGAPTLNNGDPVGLTASGRVIHEIDQGFTVMGGLHVYRLQITATATSSTPQCVGVNASNLATLRDCSGGNNNNTNWAKDFVAGGIVWINNTIRLNLTSNNALNHQLFLDDDGCMGCYFSWNN